MDMFRAIFAVANRNFNIWLKLFWPNVSSNIINPMLFLFSFGFGLGTVMSQAGHTNYLAFVVPGIMTYSVLFTASFETSIGTYTRLQTIKVIDAMLATPILLKEIVMGEILWAGTKGLISALGVMAAAAIFGGVPGGFSILTALPILFLGGMSFAAAGLVFTAHARGYEFFNYFFTFWVTPNFMFSGVFFDMNRFPEWLEKASWFLPARHIIETSRPLVLQTAIDPKQLALSISYLCLTLVIAYWISYRKLRLRLFD